MIQILSNISKSKGKQTIKFSQLIKYKMGSIFLEKSYTICGAGPPPFYKKSKYLWINILKCYEACFYCMSMSKSTKRY